MLLDLTSIPHLTTSRLVLRSFNDTDLNEFATMLADPEVMHFKNGGRPATWDESWRGLVNIMGHWVLRGFGLFAVENRETGTFVGTVGVIQPEGWPGIELTWTVCRHVWGQGYATEAAAAVRDWTFQTQKTERLISLIEAENLASVRVAEKIGEHFDRNDTFFGKPILVYAIDKS